MHIPGKCHYPRYGLGWAGGKKGAWGRGAGARHCTTLNVPLKVLPISQFHQESGHPPLSQRARSPDKKIYRNDFLFLLPRGSCSQWIIGCTCTFTRNSFHAEAVYKVLMKAFPSQTVFSVWKMTSSKHAQLQLHCVFAKTWMHMHFCFIIIRLFCLLTFILCLF